MILSMTGYGKSDVAQNGRAVKVELKSLNNRYFDVNFRISSSIRDKESDIRSMLSEKLQRGKIDVSISMENGSEYSVSINKELAKKYFAELKSLSKELDAGKKDLLSMVLQIPDVMGTSKGETGEQDWKLVAEALTVAANDLIEFRKKEGRELEAAFIEHVRVILKLLDEVEPFEKERMESVRSRLDSQLKDTTAREAYDRNRFEQELIYYLERMDFTEEKVRLRSHCDFFLKTMEESDSNGRRLGFISQEMGREINTLGSKANHAAIQKLVVQMKDELEKIKEQLLNVL